MQAHLAYDAGDDTWSTLDVVDVIAGFIGYHSYGLFARMVAERVRALHRHRCGKAHGDDDVVYIRPSGLMLSSKLPARVRRRRPSSDAPRLRQTPLTAHAGLIVVPTAVAAVAVTYRSLGVPGMDNTLGIPQVSRFPVVPFSIRPAVPV
jgi:hypothetical protein